MEGHERPARRQEMADDILHRLRAAAAIAAQVDDHRVAAGKEAHRSLQRGGALRADPLEAVIFHVADIAGQDPERGHAVIGRADLALVAAGVRLRPASGRELGRLPGIEREVEMPVTAGGFEIGVDPLGELGRIGEVVAAGGEAAREDRIELRPALREHVALGQDAADLGDDGARVERRQRRLRGGCGGRAADGGGDAHALLGGARRDGKKNSGRSSQDREIAAY